MINLIFLLIFLPIFFIRWLRWLALVQQKEYRLDRLSLFFKSEEGKNELTRFLPFLRSFSLSSIKRPKKTLRVLVIAGISGLLFAGIFALGFQLNFFYWLFLLFGVLIAVPAVVLLATLPTIPGFELVSLIKQQQAKQKIGRSQVKIIGITGSYGKTTTKLLIKQVLAQKFSVFATQRSFNTKYSLPQDITQRFQKEEILVLEYGAYKPGEIGQLTRLFPPDIAVITGLTDQHLGLFGSRDRIIQAKSELVAALPKGGLTLVNGADPGTVKIARAGKAKNIKHYSGGESQLAVSNPDLNQSGQLRFEYKDSQVQTQLVGRHYLQAVKAAIVLGEYLDIKPDKITQALKEFEPPEFMLQMKTAKQGVVVLDDGYSSNPRGFLAALELLSELKGEYQQAVLLTAGIVDLGQKSAKIHQHLARRAESVVDQVLYCGVSGRKEFQQVFASNLIMDEKEIREHIDQLSKSDILLLEGRIPPSLRNYLEI